MISQDDLKVISTVFDKPIDEISGAISNEQEISLGLRLNGKVITQEEEKNLRESGVKQGKELASKELAKSLGLELESGEKDPVVIAEKLKNNLSASFEEKYKNQSPSEELLELQSKIQESENKYEKLKTTYEESQSLINEKENQYNELQNKIKNEALNNKILQSLPEKLRIDKNDALVIIRNSLQFDETEDGHLLVKRDDQIVTDPVGKPEKIENVIKSFIEEKKYIKGASGMNGDDRSPSGVVTPKGMSYDEAVKYLETKGIDPMSKDGMEMFSKMTK